MTLVTAKWSVPEYRQMIATGLLDERQVELIAGEIIEMSPEGPEHSFTCDSLGEYLRQQLQGRAKIREAHPISLIDSEPEPDIAIVKLPATQYRDRHPQPADIHWLIEIANSTLTKDLGPKKELYAAVGILEYWVIDLQNQELVVFRDLQGTVYRSETRYQSGTISPLAFDDLSLDISIILN
jgi:Uma2 family endonuclease